jgi:hypothetical protein
VAQSRPMAGAVLDLAAAMTNLAITIMNRRGTTSGRGDNDTVREPRAKQVPTPGVGGSGTATTS